MNVTALRAIILVVNLGLIGLVAWTSYLTFVFVDLTEWKVQPPVISKFVPPPVDDDPLRVDREAYATIYRMFEHEVKEPPKPKEVKPVAPRPSRSDPKNLKVVLSCVVAADSDGEAKSTVMLQPPGGRNERPFIEGMKLNAYPEFRAYGEVTVKEIRREGIVLVDAEGKEVARLSSKPGGGK